MNPINWFEIYVQDMARARAFYERVLDIELQAMDSPDGVEMLGFPMDDDRYGASGTLVRIEGVPSGGGGTLIYFRCEDCGEAASRVADAGGSVMREKTSIGEYGFVVLVRDSEGNQLGLHSNR